MKNDKGKKVTRWRMPETVERMQDARGWLEEQLRDGDFLKQA